jgi:hypothetical protein
MILERICPGIQIGTVKIVVELEGTPKGWTDFVEVEVRPDRVRSEIQKSDPCQVISMKETDEIVREAFHILLEGRRKS